MPLKENISQLAEALNIMTCYAETRDGNALLEQFNTMILKSVGDQYLIGNPVDTKTAGVQQIKNILNGTIKTQPGITSPEGLISGLYKYVLQATPTNEDISRILDQKVTLVEGATPVTVKDLATNVVNDHKGTQGPVQGATEAASSASFGSARDTQLRA